ncbi:TIR domain-containing protein [Cohnella nanjingensis]|uniref:TIR domain-containing protein n=1 Tax=Cohnella nanjingensis TaxID=1387779 RepID=A0A7X0RWW5_9BACL|nr:TIR domain-containing protein [Cohnella nanjingensis]MBB6675126.1 TIR domain-containing protein [Cohnella nanjingensis]
MSLNKERNPPYQLYFSHTWHHDGASADIRALLGGQSGFRFVGALASGEDPLCAPGRERELYESIRRKMKHCHAVLLLCGVYPLYSKWINKEIIACKEEVNKPLIAVERFEPAMTSMIVRQNADAIVGWNAADIVKAVKDLVKIH